MVEGNFYHFFNFWRPAVVCVAPAAGEKSIIPCASTFVNIKFAQKINQIPPEILSFVQTKKILEKNKKTLAFFKPIAYNNTCKEQTTTIEKEIGWGMDKRINYLMGLDTETCNGIVTDDKLDLSQSIVYDIGWVITDKQGRIYETRSFLIYEIFVGMKDVMASAYYADKIPMYWEQVKTGQRKLVRFSTMYNQFWADVKKYNVKNAFAHNARFDYNALNNTIRYITKSNKRFFFPRKIEMWDTLKMSRQTIGKQKSYRKYCEIHNFVTKHRVPQPRLTAEILYRYITGDVTFEESHTGLEDVLIETKIMVHCFRQHKKMGKRLFAA